MNHSLQRLGAIALLWMCHFSIFSQITFQRSFSISDSTLYNVGGIETTEGNIAFTSTILQRIPDNPNIVHGALTLLNPSGQLLWTLEFNPGPNYFLRITDLEAAPDGGVVVLMYERETEVGAYHFHIVKVNAAGTTDWIKTANLEGFHALPPTIKAVTGGYLIDDPNTSAPGTLICKVDYEGNVLWQHNFYRAVLYADRSTEDDNGNLYLPGGYSVKVPDDSYRTFPFLAKLSPDGTLTWSKIYLDSFIVGHPLVVPGGLAFRKCLYQDGILSLFGNNFFSGNLVITQTDTDGNPILQKRFFNAATGGVLSLVDACQDAAGNIFGVTYYTPNQNSRLFKLDKNLEMLWLKQYQPDENRNLNLLEMSFLNNRDGFLFTGALFDSSFNHIAILKTGLDGGIDGPCCPKEKPVFQSYPYEVYAVDTPLTTFSLPVFKPGNVYFNKIEGEVNPICSTPAIISQKDTVICPGRCTEVSVTNPVPGLVYSWSFPMAMPDSSSGNTAVPVCFGNEGQYHIILSEQGCVIDSGIQQVNRRPEQYPNAFTPNGDGINEIFRPVGWCPVEEFSMEVYNRWGQRVFISTAPNEGWNGEVNGSPAPPDVYIYQVTYYAYINGVRTMLSNEKKEVTLIR